MTFDSLFCSQFSSYLCVWPFLHFFHYILTLCLSLLLLFHLLARAITCPPRTVTTFYISVSNLLQLFINIKTWCSFYSSHFENKLFFPNRKISYWICSNYTSSCLSSSDNLFMHFYASPLTANQWSICGCLSNQSFFLLSTAYPTCTHLSWVTDNYQLSNKNTSMSLPRSFNLKPSTTEPSLCVLRFDYRYHNPPLSIPFRYWFAKWCL